MNSIPVYVMPDGRSVPIPADIAAQTRFTKMGLPDARCKTNVAFAAWLSAQVPVMNGDTSREPEDVIEKQEEAALREAQAVTADTATPAQRAQVYALRVWSGQSAELKRAERIERVERALRGQNLPTDGILYPKDEEEWTEEDEQPITWKLALPKPKGIV